MNEGLMKVKYQDADKSIFVSAYADTLIYDAVSGQKTLVGIRFGGYPEMVGALVTAINGGGTLTVQTGQETIICTAKPKQYRKTMSQGGVYAVTSLLWNNDMRKQEDIKDEGSTEKSPEVQQSYLLTASDDSDALYREIDRRSIIPMLPAFRNYLLDELQRRQILIPCTVQTTGRVFDAWRLTCSQDDRNIASVITDGLKSGRIDIPGAKPEHSAQLRQITGVTSYLNTFGTTIAARIRGQFRPLFDPATETVSNAILTLNRHVKETAGYPLFPAQLAAAEALKRRLQRSKFALLIAECGSGKSKIGSLALQSYFLPQGRKRLHLVLCPSHMTEKWVRELNETIPNSIAAVVQTPTDFDLLYHEFERGDKTAFAILSKESARDGYMRRPAVTWSRVKRGFICPDCGQVTEMELLECGKKITVPATPEFFRMEARANHRCAFCGAVLWTATYAEEQSEWVRISLLGYVHRQFAARVLENCKTEASKEQLTALLHHPERRTYARGACRRYPLSTYIKNKYSGKIDGLIADELHQYAANSGQGDSMGELFAAAKKCIGMTATLINGYASGIFYLLYRICASLMERDGQTFASPIGFTQEYGVIQTTYTTTEGGYNANRRTTKRKQREKQLPGVSPLVYSRFLLENAVFLSLLDMGKELPEYEEIPVPLQLTEGQTKAYEQLEHAFREILKDRSREMRMLAQKLLSVYLNLLMAYPDQPYGHPPVVNPFNGNALVEPEDSAIPGEPTVKDQTVLDLIERKIKAGEKVLLYVNWVRLDSRERMCRLLRERGIRVEVMEDTVAPRKREQWVESHLRQGMQVLIVNPSLVETGLDLNTFTTLIFYDIAFKLFTFRQASRRSWRINQTAPRVEVYVFYYRHTMQERAVRLMASKLAVAGVIEGALTDEGLAAMSDCQDMTTVLAKELAEGIRHEHAVEDIAASFKRMAILHVKKERQDQSKRTVERRLPVHTVSAIQLEQLSLWELAG